MFYCFPLFYLVDKDLARLPQIWNFDQVERCVLLDWACQCSLSFYIKGRQNAMNEFVYEKR